MPLETNRLRGAPNDSRTMTSASQPIQNVTLQAADRDGSPLSGLVTWIDVAAGDILVERGVATDIVYFPETAVLSFVCELGDGKSLEVASVGRKRVHGRAQRARRPVRGVRHRGHGARPRWTSVHG
jgi:hypothetical protein